MKRLHVSRGWWLTGGGLLVLLLLTGAYFTLRYTVVAEALESISSVDEGNPLAYGATLFETRGCAGCHALQKAAASGDTGPDLTGLKSRGETYIRTSIVDPAAVVVPVCPEGPCEVGVMPNYGTILNESQVDALVAYLSE